MKILLTSFDTWEPHQQSNSSDVLLDALTERDLLDRDCYALRKLLVNFIAAPKQVIAELYARKPDVLICCGMAESRQFLSVESTGRHLEESLVTPFDLEKLIQGASSTQISHNAGSFVCNHLYYSVLKSCQEQNLNTRCLFVHVPLLTQDNLEPVIHDFLEILQNIKTCNVIPN